LRQYNEFQYPGGDLAVMYNEFAMYKNQHLHFHCACQQNQAKSGVNL